MAITNQRVGNYKAALLMVQCQLQSSVWLKMKFGSDGDDDTAGDGWTQMGIKCWPGFYIQNVILLTQRITIYKLCKPRHLT